MEESNSSIENAPTIAFFSLFTSIALSLPLIYDFSDFYADLTNFAHVRAIFDDMALDFVAAFSDRVTKRKNWLHPRSDNDAIH